MPQNIEIKARARDPEQQRRRAALLADGPEQQLEQTDTFYHVGGGRLKFREQTPGDAELIYYRRADQANPKLCDYLRVGTTGPHLLKTLLAEALGVRQVVRKTRRLYLRGQTRIHVDEVVGLGAFLELEVVLRPEQSAADGEEIVRSLMRELDIAQADLISCAYVDLLAREPAPSKNFPR